MELAKHPAAVVILPSEQSDHVNIEVRGQDTQIAAEFQLSELPSLLGLLPAIDLIYSCLVDAGDPLAIAEAAVDCLRSGDRFRVLFHDYFPLCPSYDLIGADGGFCDLPGAATCQACYARLVRLTGRRPPTIAEWRARWRALLDRADEITLFSEASRSLVLRVWPELEPRVHTVSHDMPHLPRPFPPRKRKRSPPVIGVLGGISRAKGAGVLHELAECASDRLRIVVIGALDPGFSHPAIRVHGRYDRNDIRDLAELYGIDRWFIPSIWPETFSFTSRECLATGLPVYAFALGAQGEAVRTAKNGLPLPPDLRGADLASALAT